MEGGYEYGNWVIFGLCIYMAAMLFIGWYASKRIKGATDYIVAGRRLGIFFCTGTLFATWFGSGTCMGGAGNAYIFGNQGVIFDPWGAALCLLLTGFFFARLMRRGKYLTLVDLFEIRFGKAMGVCATIALVIAEVGWVGAQLVGFGTIIHFFAGVPLPWGITISTIILVVYTYLGGMWSVTLTDVFQVIIVTIGMIVMLFVAVPLVGGWDAIFSNDPAGNWMGINQWSFIPTPASAADPELGNAGFMYYTGYMGWFYWLGAWLAIGFGSIPAQDLMQRVLSAKDEKTASYSSYLASGLYCVVGMMPVIIGMIYFKLNPDLSLDDALNKILLNMAVEHLNPFFAVIFVSALVAALMSSSDSAILAAASCLGYNGYKYFNPKADEQQTLKATRIFIPIVTIFSLIMALQFQVIYNLMVVAWSVLLVGLFAPYAAAYFWKKANHYGAISAFLGGFSAWIIAYFIHLPATSEANIGIVEEGVVYFDWAMWDSLYVSSVWGLMASILCLIVVSLATQKSDPPKPLRDMDGKLLNYSNWAGIFGKGREYVEEETNPST
ncbi:MAG: sodium:solute symporter family protein [Desulfobacterales bacterium]|nr:sodium:solute symporter family protein [Desulfobacterales bacterium]